jgi:hypothetical protein
MLSDSPKISTPKKIHYSKSPQRYILKKSKRRECTPDSPEMKSHTDVKMNRIRQMLEREKTPKNNFLSLIEESLNEVGENYYNYLGSQITPDCLFSTIFNEKAAKNFSVKKLMEGVYSKNVSKVKNFKLGSKSNVATAF